jgi:hypothetical protein
MRSLLFALLAAGCSLEGFASGSAGAGGQAGSGGSGATGGAGGGEGGCVPCACDGWSEVRVSDAGPAVEPSLAWLGDAWGIAWQDARDGNNEIYFARVDASGVKLGGDLRVTDQAAESILPSLVFNGMHPAIAYEDTRTGNSAAYLAWLDPIGEMLTLDLEVWKGTGAPQAPAVAWTGQNYLMVWEDFRNASFELRKGLVDTAGMVPSQYVDQAINEANGNERRPAMTFGAFETAVAWHDDRDGNTEIYFARLDGTGAKIGAETRVTDAAGDSSGAALAWNDNGYGLVWSDARDGTATVYFAGLTDGGAKRAAEHAVAQSFGPPSIAWDGSNYAMAWQGDGVIFGLADPSGALLTTALRIDMSSGVASMPSVAWSGSAYALAWQDDRDGTSAIYFATCLKP